ncbi:MAG: hypothetical protein K2K20_13080 [Lachnospiraceae bacterium]|nr:hypothetical protein [Lachnospiraceae bacterium]
MKFIKVISNISTVLILCCFLGGCVSEQVSGEVQQVTGADIVNVSEGDIEEPSQNLPGNESEILISSENETQNVSPELEGENITYYTMEEVKALDIPEDMLAYWMVLNGKKPFISYDMGGQEFYWDEFWGIRVDQFMIVDMDNDGGKEVVLYCCPESTWILHYEDGSVYGYEFVFRGMKRIRTNGIYQGSSGAGSGAYCRLTELNADGYTEETLVKYDYYGHVYEVGGKDVSEDEALEFIESIESNRDGSELADQIDGADSSYLLGSLPAEERSIVENVQREEILYPAASYPMDAETRKAYYDVLMNQREFISTMDDNERFYLKDYFPREEYQPDESDILSSLWRPDKICYFSIVDMDGDGTYEVILDGTYARDILSYRNGEVYSYRLNGGAISNSGIVCISEYTQKYGRIVSFNDYEHVMETVDYDGDINDDRIQYYSFSEELIEQYFK